MQLPDSVASLGKDSRLDLEQLTRAHLRRQRGVGRSGVRRACLILLLRLFATTRLEHRYSLEVVTDNGPIPARSQRRTANSDGWCRA